MSDRSDVFRFRVRRPSVKALAQSGVSPMDLIHRGTSSGRIPPGLSQYGLIVGSCCSSCASGGPCGGVKVGGQLNSDIRARGQRQSSGHLLGADLRSGLKVGSCCSSCASGGPCGGLKVGSRSSSKRGRRRGVLSQLKKAFGL